MLVQLENKSSDSGVKTSVVKKEKLDGEPQLSFFQLDDPVLSEIRSQIENLDINSLTPVEALLKLNEIKKMVVGEILIFFYQNLIIFADQLFFTIQAKVAQLVEHDLAKVGVAGSNPVFRSAPH